MERVVELENMIKKYAESYYSGVSEVSDDKFDELVDELRTLSPDSEVLTTGWGFNPKNKMSHLYGLHIGSLSKIKAPNPVEDYSSEGTRISAKLDGLSVVSYYKEGRRILALTRGNGNEGIDVTKKMSIISPETEMTAVKFSGAVRGEVVISNDSWKSVEEVYSTNPSANQRNVASGLLNRNDISSDLEILDYVVYKILADEEDEYNSIKCVDSDIASLGFTIVPYTYCIDKSPDSLRKIYDTFNRIYPCDGLVLTKDTINTVNNIVNYEEIAYKFQAESKEVVVTNVTYSLTRTGRMVPRIWFDPIELSGAMVQKCTGFNAKYVSDNKINIGSKVRVCRSGEVIPYILEVIESSEEGLVPFEYAGDRLEWDGVDLIVPDYDGMSAYHFISTVAPVDGVGWSLYSRICEVAGIGDRFSLIEFLKQINFDRTIAYDALCDNISGEVTRSKIKEILRLLTSEVDPVRFLVACNIHGVSWKVAQSIIEEYPEIISDIREGKLNYDKLYEIKGIGRSTVMKLSDRISYLRDLSYIVKISSPSIKSEYRFKVAITGSLSVKRSDFIRRLEDSNIGVSGNLKECKYLITNTPESGSSKNISAKRYGVDVISEKEFIDKYEV